MEVRFVDVERSTGNKPIHVAEINGARIACRNFSGEESQKNREGDRNFLLVLPDEDIADLFLNDTNEYGDSWNVHVKNDNPEDPWIYIPVKVKFNSMGPSIFLVTGGKRRRITEKTVHMLDRITIANIDLDLTASDKIVNGKSYRTAYLRAMEITQSVNRFEERYTDEEFDDED